MIEVSYDVRTGCNQGIGNGSEGCDPGNSNQGDPANSNDEPTGNGPGDGNNNAGGNGVGNDNGNNGNGNGNVEIVRVTREIEVHVPCEPGDGDGKVATVVLDLSDPSVPQDAAQSLTTQVVDWVKTVTNPKVLVVEDDRNVGADSGDVDRITDWLAASGYDVTQIDEPQHGLAIEDVEASTWCGSRTPVAPWTTPPPSPCSRGSPTRAAAWCSKATT